MNHGPWSTQMVESSRHAKCASENIIGETRLSRFWRRRLAVLSKGNSERRFGVTTGLAVLLILGASFLAPTLLVGQAKSDDKTPDSGTAPTETKAQATSTELSIFKPRKKSQRETPPITKRDDDTAAKQDGTKKADKAGRLISISNCQFRLIDRVTLAVDQIGILEDVNVRPGDVVKKGQELARVRDDRVRRAKGDLESAEADYAQTQQLKKLIEKGVVGADAAFKIEKAKVEFAKAHAEFELARRASAVQSPIQGIVTRVHKQRGEAVQPAEAIVEVINIGRLRLEGYVSVNELWTLKVGMPVAAKVRLHNSDHPILKKTFRGKLVFVSPEVETVTNQIRVWAEIDNSDGMLRPGLIGTMTIDSGGQLATPEKPATAN